jgi:hypothetical protein
MLGFMPNKHSNSTPSVVVERAAKTIHLTISPQRVLQLPAEGAEHLQPGSFPIVLKQTEPVWYAPTRYFRSRGLAVPEEGRKERFRRGALGTKALFLDGQTPIHDGPVWSDEIGGIKLDSEAMTALFDALQVGSRIEVR